ncbi:LysE family translocator [Microbispora sp. NPDC049125]|uniref:LysE family translocator n=1 Tax=Microbispora sp. NPDC049125 TaxID=3154929 RepID=UPI0034663019
MSHLANLLVFGGVWTVIVISPGPDLMVTMRLAVRRSRAAALAAVLGIAMGTAIWASAAATGLAFLLAQERWLTQGIRWCGAAYLLVLAVQAVRHAGAPLAFAQGAGDPSPGPGLVAAWRTGLFADLSNPKAAIFWSSLFATSFPQGTPSWTLATAVVLAVLIAGGWYMTAALLLSIGPVLRLYERVKRWVDYATGGILTALAARLATTG